MPQDSAEIAERIFALWAEGNFGATTEYFDPHVVHVISEEFPESGVFHGEAGMREYPGGFLSQWEHFAIAAKRLRVAGGTVLADVLQHSTGKASGVESDLHAYVAFTFRGERVVRSEFFMHERDALAAVGLDGA
jgi:ketosteroid isomerase-like protein